MFDGHPPGIGLHIPWMFHFPKVSPPWLLPAWKMRPSAQLPAPRTSTHNKSPHTSNTVFGLSAALRKCSKYRTVPLAARYTSHCDEEGERCVSGKGIAGLCLCLCVFRKLNFLRVSMSSSCPCCIVQGQSLEFSMFPYNAGRNVHLARFHGVKGKNEHFSDFHTDQLVFGKPAPPMENIPLSFLLYISTPHSTNPSSFLC